MAKTALLYRLDTHELDGAISVSQDGDLQFYPGDPTVHGLIDVPADHPAIHDQANWRVQNGILVKKDA